MTLTDAGVRMLALLDPTTSDHAIEFLHLAPARRPLRALHPHMTGLLVSTEEEHPGLLPLNAYPSGCRLDALSDEGAELSAVMRETIKGARKVDAGLASAIESELAAIHAEERL